ncbi:MAG: hypothetical protein ABJZ79_00710, partial [Parasphingorhabdus sp.]|uniref:hypothetical protein n=1 Tax=Parasphingorhabdus sp. TaxID=2709688 RepID=UPI00329880C0
DAFSLDPMMTSRATFGFLDGDRLDFMKNRVLSLLEDYGVMIVHPSAKAALLRAGARKGSEAGR